MTKQVLVISMRNISVKSASSAVWRGSCAGTVFFFSLCYAATPREIAETNVRTKSALMADYLRSSGRDDSARTPSCCKGATSDISYRVALWLCSGWLLPYGDQSLYKMDA